LAQSGGGRDAGPHPDRRLRDVGAGRAVSRRTGITIFDSTGRAIQGLAIALACASTVDAKSSAAPANDNFANAQVISGASGTATGSKPGRVMPASRPRG